MPVRRQVQRGEADGVVPGGPDGVVRAGREPVHELPVSVVGGASGGRRRRRCGTVGDGGHGAGGVRGAGRPRGHGTAAERHHGGATGDDRRVPPAGQVGPVAAPRRRQPVPGAGRHALRGRPPAAQARGSRAAHVSVHGCAERHASVRRVSVERTRARRPHGVPDEGDARDAPESRRRRRLRRRRPRRGRWRMRRRCWRRH